MFATQVLPETLSNENSEEYDNVSEVMGYLIVKEKKYEVKKGETKIGRDSSMCSIVIENFTVSKVHAVIESEGVDDTFIYDVGSTNQTKLGKKVLKPHCRYKLDDNSKLTIGNIIAEFVHSPHKSSVSNLETPKLNADNLNPLDELGSIFDLATQVTTPEVIPKIPVFEKPPEKHSNIKIPNVVLLAKQPLESLKNVFDEVTQCRLDSQDTTFRTVFRDRLSENSNIYNLSTQCQLYESQTKEINSSVNDNDSCKNKDEDKIKSLLNDGQDDVLCVFMSLHSPKEQNNEELVKEIKTEMEDMTEVFDAPTQIQPVVLKQAIKLFDSSGKNTNEDFCKKTVGKPSVTSTPFSVKSNQNEISENCSSQHSEEDFIKTQEFNEGNKSVKVSENVGNLSQDKDTQLFVDDALDDMSTTEQKNTDEDFILTQAFEDCESRHNAKSTVIPESEDINETEDFMETQIYDVDKEILGSNIINKGRTTEQLPEDGVECNLNETLDFTQRNNQDDFIETQVFEEIADLRKIDKNLVRCINNADDFIATQPFDIIGEKLQTNDNGPKSGVEKSSRESSPDLTGFKNTWQDNEDLIATQSFDLPEYQTSSKRKPSEQTYFPISSSSTTERNSCNVAQEFVESSGDETESDLEIILDKTETRNAEELTGMSFKTESEVENCIQPQNMEAEESNSNSSYIFELGPKNALEGSKDIVNQQRRVASMSDSDETDCEELAVIALKQSVKQESLERVELEETQVPAITPPQNYQEKTSDVFINGELEESPKFESGIENEPKSPELLTKENETNKSLENADLEDFQIPSKIKKTEVGVSMSRREADSPLKRPLDNIDHDVVPIKKSKTEVLDRSLNTNEKKLLKLVQAHDIAQIQPSRTRNSIKLLTTENKPDKTDTSVTNEYPTSRRKHNPKKINGDITSYLIPKKTETRRTSCRERVKATSAKEKKKEPTTPVESSSRVLRSSKRSSGNGASSVEKDCGRDTPIRRSRRISRTKNEEYFTNSCVNVVFTGFGCDSLDKIITELGGKKANDLSCSEVVVADKVRRTVKFLCAIGLGLPITSPEWLLSCKREKKFLNPWNFILKDEESEERYNFELKTSLERSKRVKLFEGFNIFATKSTKPPVKELLDIVESCGGTPIHNPPNVWPKKTIIVSCLEDKQCWPLPKLRNVKIVHYEFILGGVLRQKIDFKTYKLR